MLRLLGKVNVPGSQAGLHVISKAWISQDVNHNHKNKESDNDHNISTDSESNELFLNPSAWKGLEPQRIIELYWERKTKLGSAYEKNEDELNALLSTADFSGIPKPEIKKIYNDKNIGNFRVNLNKDVLKYGLRPFQFDELPSAAIDIVEEHREQRFYNRLAAYELPLLAKYRQEYKKPSSRAYPITYRYTSYLGEDHPNSKKVVVSVYTKDLGLGTKELHKFRLLARTRYDHQSDLFKMSSDKFESAAQNARYLHDILQRLIAESKDLTDDFSDIPLDTRHTIAKNLRKKRHNYEFPEEWKRPQDAPIETVDLTKSLIREP